MSQNRLRQIRRVLWITLALNFLVALAKLIYGYFTESLSMMADGYHSLLDGTSNIIGLVAVGFAAKPADDNHPYGHRKIEAIAAILISGMMFLSCYEILSKAYFRLSHTVTPEVTLWSFLIMLGTMTINLGVSRYEHREGERLSSQILTADSAHTATDFYASLSVMIALGAAYFQLFWLDIAAAILIALLVGYSGYKIVWESIHILIDTAPLDPEPIAQIALKIPGVQHCHHIRTRGHSKAIYMDLNIHVDPKMNIQSAHELSHQVIQNIKDKMPEVIDVVVHTEPATPHE
ncbi:MAG: cation transporter [Deltaproteobacteria bacterium]|nr:cation transporter [Deltaproteobacteria bacterium]